MLWCPKINGTTTNRIPIESSFQCTNVIIWGLSEMPTPAIAGVELRLVKRFDSVMRSWQMTWQPPPPVSVMARANLGIKSILCYFKIPENNQCFAKS
jgi:hypothetical protein